ncbi:MAG: hypothetical protein BRD55_05405 [Bacteroidetes bacterium SW_9_63_38]|nr:MAG: hypothetical protein BRD55_05405 [Bacteroidetes bacterium SW_9_63_38]
MRAGLTALLVAVLATTGAGCSLFGSDGGGGDSSETEAPDAPSGLSATSGNSQVELDWSTVDGVQAYRVYRAESSSSTDPLANEAVMEVSDATTYTDGSAKNGTEYKYVVTSVGTGGSESAPSNTARRTPFAEPGSRPSE